MAEGQEPGRRVFLPAQCYCFLEGPWGSCCPGRVSMDGSGRELLMDRSMATPFSCSQTFLPGAETLPLPASYPCLYGPGAPSPSVHAGCSAGAHIQVWNSERRGLWSGLFPWLHPDEGRGLGTVGNRAGPTSQGQLHATRGCRGDLG